MRTNAQTMDFDPTSLADMYTNQHMTFDNFKAFRILWTHPTPFVSFMCSKWYTDDEALWESCMGPDVKDALGSGGTKKNIHVLCACARMLYFNKFLECNILSKGVRPEHVFNKVFSDVLDTYTSMCIQEKKCRLEDVS